MEHSNVVQHVFPIAFSFPTCWRGRWNRETWQRGTRLNRSQRVEHPSAQEINWTWWTISELNHVCHDSTEALWLIVACSFCTQSAISSALIRSSYSRGSTTEVTATAARTKTWTRMVLAVPPAPTSGASESATAAAATTSDDCCEVCIVAPHAGFVLVPCGHRTRRQYTRRRSDDKENF